MIARRTVASMKIFQLEALRSDIIENELAGAIVFAADEAQARKIATEHETYASGDKTNWLEPSQASCVELGTRATRRRPPARSCSTSTGSELGSALERTNDERSTAMRGRRQYQRHCWRCLAVRSLGAMT